MKRAPAVPVRNVFALLMRERLDILRAGFDRGRFDVGGGIRMVRFHQADMIEEKFVAARRARAGRA